MANQNFVVHNGLTVGTTTIWAGNGDVTISGNLTVLGNTNVTIENVSNYELIKGITAATSADATALAIALGG